MALRRFNAGVPNRIDRWHVAATHGVATAVWRVNDIDTVEWRNYT